MAMEEYKKHDLAEDFDDEKRIFSAERRARATLSTLKKKRSSSFAAGRRSSLVRLSAPFTSSASKPFSLLCPLRLRFGAPIWAVVLLVVNPGIGVLPVRRWPNSSLLLLQSDFKIRINQVLLIPFLIIIIWL